jgi:addiction module RelE/StbE family toxin
MSSKYTLMMLPQAERDLDDIFAYIAYELHNGQAAEKLIDEIAASLIGLEDMPRRCPESEIPELKRDGYRKCVVENYVALYTLDDEKRLIKVAKVFYGMRDYKNLGLF